MSDNINLLSEELEPKGYIPKPVIESTPSRPAEVQPTMKEPVTEINHASDVVINSTSQNSENNFDAMSRANLNAQRSVSAVSRRPLAPKKVSFWDKLFGKNEVPEPIVTQRPVVGQGVVGQVSKAAPVKAKFDAKKILSWLTAGKKSEGPVRSGINLVQSEAEVLPILTIGERILLRCSPAIIIIVVAYILTQSYTFYMESKTKDLVAKLTSAVTISDADIAKLEKNANGLDNKVTVMRNVFARHIYWSKLLEYLEQIFIAEVYIRSMTAESAGNIIIEAQTDSFTSVAKQYVLLQNNPVVKEVSITGADKSSEEDPIKFSIKLKIWPGLMYPNAFTSTSTTNIK